MGTMLKICLCLLVAYGSIGYAQVVHESYEKREELLRIGPEPERQIWMTERGHTLIIPEAVDTVTGVAVFFQRGRIAVGEDLPAPGSFDAEAFARGVAVMHVSTGNPLDFFFDEESMSWLAQRMQSVLDSHDLRDVPVFFYGLSLGGTRAAKMAQYLFDNDIRFWLKPAAVAVVDSPLDMQRFWYAETHAKLHNFHPAAADEGRWVTYLLETNLGGPPHQNEQQYVDYSVYSYTAKDGGNAVKLSNTPFRAYHEPDVNWWIDNRRKSYYAMNSLDMAGLVNQLKLLGNSKAELVTTCGERDGFDEGSSPHTWSMVNNAELIEWFLSNSE